MLVTGGWNQSVLVRIITSRHQSCSLGTGLPRFRPGSCPSGQELVKSHSSRKPRPAAHLSAPEQMFGQKGQPVPDKTVSPDSVSSLLAHGFGVPLPANCHSRAAQPHHKKRKLAETCEETENI